LSLFKKKTDAEPEFRGGNDAGKNRVSLLILLVLVAAFGYLYFFTSLIVPHETAQPAKSAEPAVTAQVKQSMPPRPADTAAAPAATGGQPPAAGAPAPPPAAPAAPAAKAQAPAPAAKAPAPAPAPAAPAKAVAAPAPAKPVPPQPAKKEEAKAVKPAEQKPAAPAAKKEVVKQVAAPAKPVQGKDKQPAAAAKPPAKEQKAADADKGKVPADKAKADTAAYMINIGEFAASEAASVEAKLGKHGIRPVKTVTQKNRMMTRLFYGAYTDYDTYSNELERLKQVVSSAFAIEKNGKYFVYAGSFGSAERAAAEKKRLAAKGVSVELQQASLPLSTVKMSAGPFSGKPAADKAAAKLKGEGLVVKVMPKGK